MTDFYTIEKRGGRWWFITPEGTPFWSIGMNHIDSAALRYVESDGVWEREFGNSHEQWLRAVTDDLPADAGIGPTPDVASDGFCPCDPESIRVGQLNVQCELLGQLSVAFQTPTAQRFAIGELEQGFQLGRLHFLFTGFVEIFCEPDQNKGGDRRVR